MDDHHGLGDPGLSRYWFLFMSLMLWLMFGFLLYRSAAWPSTCMPEGLVEAYACSGRLPESGRWHEVALLTWLWASPILLALDLTRRLGLIRD